MVLDHRDQGRGTHPLLTGGRDLFVRWVRARWKGALVCRETDKVQVLLENFCTLLIV